MMNQMHKARTIAALLAAVLCVTSLAGCGKGMGGSEKGGLDVSLDHSYAAVPFNVDAVQNPDGAIMVGDNVLLIQYNPDSYEREYYLYNTASDSAKQVDLSELDKNDEKTGEYSYIQSNLPMANGGIAFLVNSYREVMKDDDYDYKDLGTKLEIYDSEMNHVETRQISNGGDDEAANNYGDFYIAPNGGYYALKWDDTGNTVLMVLDAELKEVGSISGSYEYIEGVVSLADGSTLVRYSDKDYNSCFGKIDPAGNQLTKVEIKGVPLWSNGLIASADPDYDVYLMDSDNLYGVNMAKGTCEPVINWVNSDFIGNNINTVNQLKDGRFLVMEYGMSGDNSSLWTLTPRDPAELKNTKLISMAAINLNENLGRAVNEFNRSQNEYRIAIANYGKYNTEEDYEAGLKQLQSDMTSGIVADIIVVDGLPYESFCSKGIFADLSDKVAALSPDEYYTNYFDALRYGDKLYRMGFSYSVRSLMAKKDKVAKAGMSVGEFNDILNSLPKDTTAIQDMDRSYAVYMLLNTNMNAFVNQQTGECRFNTPEFVKLLEMCYACPEEREDDGAMTEEENAKYWAEQAYQYINDKVLFYPCWISDIRNAYSEQYQYFDKTPVTVCGFPTMKEGSNGSRFEPNFTVAISANTQYKDKCWEFLSSMLSDSYQENLDWALPVKKSAFDKKAADAMKPNTYTDENGNQIPYDETFYRGEEEIKLPNMPQSYVDDLKVLISGINETTYYDTTLSTIIDEETQKYFAGDQSAQQTADMIQSRASLYLSEQH